MLYEPKSVIHNVFDYFLKKNMCKWKSQKWKGFSRRGIYYVKLTLVSVNFMGFLRIHKSKFLPKPLPSYNWSARIFLMNYVFAISKLNVSWTHKILPCQKVHNNKCDWCLIRLFFENIDCKKWAKNLICDWYNRSECLR